MNGGRWKALCTPGARGGEGAGEQGVPCNRGLRVTEAPVHPAGMEGRVVGGHCAPVCPGRGLLINGVTEEQEGE